MTQTLRPTGLRNSGAFAHLADWSVEDGEDIGRIYQVHAAPPDRAWFWSLYLISTSPTPPRARAALREALAIAEALAREVANTWPFKS